MTDFQWYHQEDLFSMQCSPRKSTSETSSGLSEGAVAVIWRWSVQGLGQAPQCPEPGCRRLGLVVVVRRVRAPVVVDWNEDVPPAMENASCWVIAPELQSLTI